MEHGFVGEGRPADDDRPTDNDRPSNDDVTVIVTCFNYGAFLAESVHSALAQEGGAPRVIVIDDGSSDEHTLAELDRLPLGVKLIRQANTGLSEARNVALRRVETAYALILDADDRLSPHTLSCLREPLDADPELGFSYGIVRFFGAWEGILKMPSYDPYRLLFRHNIGSTALIRRELFEDVGGYDRAFRGYEDWEFWLHALERGWRGRRVEQVTLLYRRHGATMYQGARLRYRDTYRQLRRKHASLYGRVGRRRLATESELGAASRLVYRWWWGWRPLPARVELALQHLLWRPRHRRGDDRSTP
ncbi:MAG TPA: glycosyltransferase [Solirubrobacteraceae bacterium]